MRAQFTRMDRGPGHPLPMVKDFSRSRPTARASIDLVISWTRHTSAAMQDMREGREPRERSPRRGGGRGSGRRSGHGGALEGLAFGADTVAALSLTAAPWRGMRAEGCESGA